nr:metalloproteinase inhibitor 3-like [Crassostrea gigas]
MKLFTLLCLLSALAFSSTLACRCLQQHPQKQFCESDFVIKGRILSRTESGHSQLENVIYTVQIIQNYKREHYGSARRVQIFTASQSSLCGAFFQIGREYIITGSIQNNRWSTSSCSWNTESPSLTPYQRNALKFGYYRNSCACQVEICFPGQCAPPSRNKCVLDQSADNSCFYKENYCKKETYGCAWHSPACI